jgi:tetratricopeptide (TPR) repeat protein
MKKIMSRKKVVNMKSKENNNSGIIVIAIIGLIGTLITAYFGFRASTAPITLSIDATKTAEAEVESTKANLTPSNSASETPMPLSIVTPMVTYPSDCLGYDRLEEWEQAAECYKQKVIANPDDFWALSNVARVYGNDKQYDKVLGIAEEMMIVAHNDDETAEAILEMGVANYYLGDFTSAINILSTSSYYSQTSSYFLISVWLSRSYEANGEIENACEQYKATVTLAQQKNLTGNIDEYQSGVQRNCH